MLAHVERKHWWTQLPFSWGVEMVLVLALLAGTAFAATQVRGRDVTIADQSAVISQQAATIRQSEEQALTLRRVAYVDGALIEAYGTLQAHRAAMEKALRGEYGEVYESYEVQAAGAQQAQSRIEMLLAQRQVMLSIPPGYES